MEKDRQMRYQSAAELCVDLKRLRREVDSGRSSAISFDTSSPSLPVTPSPQPPHRSPRLKFVAIFAAVFIAALVLAWIFRPALPLPRVTGFTQLTHDGWQKNSFGQTTPTVLTDGTRLYVQENIHGRFVAAQVSASGGDTVPIDAPFQNVSLDNISPNNSELIVGSFSGSEVDQPLYAIPTLGGSPRRLTDLSGQDATWMPNGDLLVSHADELIAVSPSGSTHSFFSLKDPTASSYWLRWSPDHKRLRFSTSFYQRARLGEVNADGSNFHLLLEESPLGQEDLSNGNWTPDGRLFVFQAVHNWGRSDIWAIRDKPDFFHKPSSAPVQLTSGPLNFYAPQPSPDGKRLYVIGEQPRAELVRYDVKSRQFVPFLNGISARAVSFSRDGQWACYVTYPEGNLWRSRVDGTEKLQLTTSEFSVGACRWSPSGHLIAINATKPAGRELIYLVSSDGSARRELAIGTLNLLYVTWGPDDRSLTFREASDAGHGSLRTVNLDTMTISDLPSSEGLVTSFRSPDGQYLVSTNVAGDRLLLFDFSTQKWSQLTEANVGYFQWSSDSKSIYFDNGYSNDPAIYRVHLSDQRVEQVFSLGEFRRVVTPWNTWFGLTPQGDILLMHDTGSQEVYALEIDIP